MAIWAWWSRCRRVEFTSFHSDVLFLLYLGSLHPPPRNWSILLKISNWKVVLILCGSSADLAMFVFRNLQGQFLWLSSFDQSWQGLLISLVFQKTQFGFCWCSAVYVLSSSSISGFMLSSRSYAVGITRPCSQTFELYYWFLDLEFFYGLVVYLRLCIYFYL